MEEKTVFVGIDFELGMKLAIKCCQQDLMYLRGWPKAEVDSEEIADEFTRLFFKRIEEFKQEAAQYASRTLVHKIESSEEWSTDSEDRSEDVDVKSSWLSLFAIRGLTIAKIIHERKIAERN